MRGRAFHPPLDDGRARLGILGARNRVEAFGGTLTVRTGLGEGTTVIAQFPLELEAG